MTLQVVAGNANVQIQMDGNDVLAVGGNLSVFNGLTRRFRSKDPPIRYS